MQSLNLELPTFKEITKARDRRRQQAMIKRRFEAAVGNRLTSDWIAPHTSINAELRQGLRGMRARARELAHNDGYMKKFLSMCRSNIVGPRGIRLQVRAKKQSDDGLNTVLSTQVEQAFREWTHKENCTLSAKLSWLDAQNLAVTQVFRDGECLIRKVTANNRFGFGLKFIDTAYLDETYNAELTNGNRVMMSVEVDADDRAVAYYLTAPYFDGYNANRVRPTSRVRVPASEIIYLPFFLDDETATRSAPAAHAAMRNLHDLGGYIEAKVIGSRMEACQMGFLIPPATDEVPELGAEGPVVPGEIPFEPGSFHGLPPGYDMKVFDPKSPNGTESEFLKAMLKGIAVGFDVDYSTFASDLREVNFSSIRAGIQETREVFRFWQMYFAEHLHREVYLAWLRAAIAAGALEGVLVRDFDRLTDPKWLPRGWGYVNPLQDVQADARRVYNSFTTRTAVAADEGEDFEEILMQLAAEQKLAEQYGIEFTNSEANPFGAQPLSSDATAATGDQGE